METLSFCETLVSASESTRRQNIGEYHHSCVSVGLCMILMKILLSTQPCQQFSLIRTELKRSTLVHVSVHLLCIMKDDADGVGGSGT